VRATGFEALGVPLLLLLLLPLLLCKLWILWLPWLLPPSKLSLCKAMCATILTLPDAVATKVIVPSISLLAAGPPGVATGIRRLTNLTALPEYSKELISFLAPLINLHSPTAPTNDASLVNT